MTTSLGAEALGMARDKLRTQLTSAEYHARGANG
jgi:hypothetical protein